MADTDSERYVFDIEAVALGQALEAFVELTGAGLIYPQKLANETGVNPVVGVYTVKEALGVLLHGTGLSSGLTKGGTIVISLRTNEKDNREGEVPNITKRASLLAGVATTFFGTGVATAQTGESPETRPGRDTIIVTARRVDEDLQDVPASIGVFSAGEITKRRIQSINEVLDLTPGAAFTSLNKGQQDFSIRGISSQTEGAAGDSAVATYIDNIAIGKDFAKSFELFDVERVEVLRGPQGTAFGRNASAGLIHIISKRPTREFEGFIDVAAGNYGLIDVSAAVSGPLSDKLSARLSVHFDDRNGYTTDISSGEDIDDEQNISLRGQLLFEPSDELEVLLRGSWSKDDDGSTVRRGPDCTIPYLEPPFGDYTEPCDPWETDASDRDDLRLDREIFSASAEAAWTLSDSIRLTSVTGYIDASLERSQDIFGTPVDLIIGSSATDAWQISQELRLDNSAASSPLAWLVGLYFYTDDQTASGENRDVLSFAGPPFATTSTLLTANETTSVGAFAQIGYDLTDRLTITLGGRYSSDEKEFSAFHTATGGLGDVFVDPAEDPVDAQTSNDWSKFTGSASLSYDISDEAHVYALVSQGYKAGGFDGEPSTAAAALNPYDEETSTNYELGLKTELLARRLRFNASAFYVDYADLQVADFLPSGAPIIVNAGGAEIFGLEIDAVVSVTDYLTLIGSFAYLDGELQGLVSGVSVDGNRPDNAPEWTAFFAADLNIPLSNGSRIGVRGDYRGRSLTFDGPFGDVATARPEVHFIGARLSWTAPNERVELALWGRNLTNEADVVSRGPQSIVTQAPTAFGPPRTFGGSVRVSF